MGETTTLYTNENREKAPKLDFYSLSQIREPDFLRILFFFSFIFICFFFYVGCDGGDDHIIHK